MSVLVNVVKLIKTQLVGRCCWPWEVCDDGFFFVMGTLILHTYKRWHTYIPLHIHGNVCVCFSLWVLGYTNKYWC